MLECATCGAEIASDARFCPSCGAPVRFSNAEERKLATILFADVLGSTELGEQLDPERLRVVLRTYFAAMASAINAWGGTVEKYIGDAVMAVFGVPTAREDDAERALRAAQEMLTRLGELNLEFERRHGVRLEIRIGVNTGEVIAPVGARPAGQFIVSGDAVNVAARLEQASEPGTILVGERTHHSTRHVFRFGPPIELELKGKAGRVVGRRALETMAEGGRGLEFQAPMVGRERELATLIGLLEDAFEAEIPELGVVLGPAGIGKSRLLREFVAAAKEREPEVVVLRGRCLAAGHGITFWPLGEILRAACRISLDEPAQNAGAKLRTTADALLEPLHLAPDEVSETIDALATSANIGLDGNRMEGLAPEAVANAMARAWPRFLTALASASPTAILLEDLHWADERMLEMVELLATRSQGRLLILGTSRPELLDANPAFAAGRDNLTAITLRPLSERQGRQLVEALLSETDLPDKLSSGILQKADGNPFFLEEMIQRLIDEGALIREGDRWRSTARAGEIQLPDSVHALLAARIDALPADEKRVLQEAAVIGRIFWETPLTETLGGLDVGHTLLSLERKGLVLAQQTSSIAGENEYLFRHVLIRDVAYTSVPKTRRARAHADVAAWIERLAGERIEEFGEVVAHHYRSAIAGEDADLAWTDEPSGREEARRRAVQALLAAGASARRRFAVAKAVELHGAALELAETDAERIQAHEALGDDHDALFHGDEAVAEYMEVTGLAHAGRSGDAVMARVAAKTAETASRFGAFRSNPDPQHLEELVAEGLARVGSDEAVRARLLIAQGGLNRAWMGRQLSRGLNEGRSDPTPISERIRSAQKGLALAERIDQPELIYLATDVLAVLHWSANEFGAYRRDFERQLSLLPRVSSHRQRADILFGASVATFEQGDYGEAARLGERAYALAAELSPHEAMHASFAIMLPSYMSGAWDRVLELLPSHVAAARLEPEVTCAAVRSGPVIGAIILVARGHSDEALAQVAIDEVDAETTGLNVAELFVQYSMSVGRPELASTMIDRLLRVHNDLLKARESAEILDALPALGRWEELEQLLPRARAFVEAFAHLGPAADRAEAALLRHQGRFAEAIDKLRQAVAGFDRLDIPFGRAQAREELAEDVPAERRQLLKEAMTLYQRLAAEPHARRVGSLLAAAAD